MPKTSKKPAKEIELEPDAWQRFERLIVKAAKTPPQHRSPKTAKVSRHKGGGKRAAKDHKH
ncbi:MAG TPA: hypothetical protein VGR52_04215 [Stellaceae bacterium]|nr:hypothetical protein [Stellaceae bacterium]